MQKQDTHPKSIQLISANRNLEDYNEIESLIMAGNWEYSNGYDTATIQPLYSQDTATIQPLFGHQPVNGRLASG